MAVIQLRSNDALNINPPAGDEHLSVHGSDWLWAVFAVYLASFLAVFALSFAARAGERVFHYVYSIGLFVGVVTYFAMASDLGFVVVRTVNQESRGLSRQVFFAHYINWVVAFPAAILSLGLVSGLPWATIVYQIFLSWIWVVAYLVGAFTTSNYKWGFYAFGTFAWILLAVSQWLLDGRRSAVRVGVARDFNMLSGWLNLLWLLYPLAYGLSDGGNRIGVTPSFIWYGILDALLLPVLAFATLVLSRNWDYSGLNIAFTQYGRVPVAGGHFPEKEQAAAAAPATATPAGGPGVVAPEPAVTA
ncbi:hypothetical protein SPBR_01941 [Sporothrix brasiliensis 5110]|uniref:Heat shock protein 30 n=1 Tax=Sporothrix brasiliensis 5110 TaxID=1398154 RepID=A0A0C2IRD1_9PEZI|nr:uncharacterized protein SPBR_01941 [Sporothrix brasiliensis 5110]KIH91581.1 hypothetical protein SPBR_01941 [Sporothrix brasiliensis 5110]